MRNFVTCGLAALAFGVAAQAALAAGPSPATVLTNQPSASVVAAQPGPLRGTSGFAVPNAEKGKTMGVAAGGSGAALLRTLPQTTQSASALSHQSRLWKRK